MTNQINREREAFDQGVEEGKSEAYAKIGDDVLKYARQRGNAAGKAAVSKEFRERIGFGKARATALKAEVKSHFDSLVSKQVSETAH